MESLVLLTVWIIMGTIGAVMAEKRNRNKIGWFAICFFFGLIGIAILAILGENKEVKKENLITE